MSKTNRVISDWCVTHKRYHGKRLDTCEVVATREILGESFVSWMEKRGIKFVDVYPVSMDKKKGGE